MHVAPRLGIARLLVVIDFIGGQNHLAFSYLHMTAQVAPDFPIGRLGVSLEKQLIIRSRRGGRLRRRRRARSKLSERPRHRKQVTKGNQCDR